MGALPAHAATTINVTDLFAKRAVAARCSPGLRRQRRQHFGQSIAQRRLRDSSIPPRDRLFTVTPLGPEAARLPWIATGQPVYPSSRGRKRVRLGTSVTNANAPIMT